MAQAETTHATTAQGGGHEVGFPPFDTSTYGGQLLWLAITFALLYVMLSRVVLPRLTGTIETRDRTISSDLEAAQAMKVRAEEAGTAYEKALADARGRAQALAAETRSALNAKSDARRKELEAELSTKLAAADQTIAARKGEAMGNVRAIAQDSAAAIVEHLTGEPAPAGAVDAALARQS